MGRLAGKTAIVTGGAQGQGAQIARAFVAEDARVVIADVAQEAGEALAAELGEAATFMKHDVSNEESWQATVTAANEKFGPVNVLVNNAGILRFNALEFTPLEEYMQLVNINQVGCFLGMKSVTRPMRKNGGDRKRVGSGKSGSVRVGQGGGRRI